MTTEKCKGKNILLVEDDEASRVALQTILVTKGACVAVAKDGEQGLKMALSGHPDLIVTDLLMPTMNGLEMIHKLRMDDWGKTVKIVALTNVEDVKKVDEVVGMEVFEYFIKGSQPIDELAEHLIGKLNKYN